MMLFSNYSHAQYTCDNPIQAECDNQNGLDWHLSDQGNTPLWFNFNACNKDLEFSFYMSSNLNDSSAYLGIDSISVYENNGDCENPTLIQTFYSFQFLMNLDQGVDYLIKIYLIEDIDEEYNFSILIRSLIESNCISNCMTNNLIINGDFEYTTSVPYDLILLGGNPHTSLDYAGTSFGNGYGKFAISGLIGAHPFTYNLNYGTTFDHTTGSGNFMYIDPPSNSNTITVWQQDNIPVVHGKEYLFSVWVKQLIGCFLQGCNNFPRINIYINNQEIISLYEINHINWKEICYNWTANTTGNISIKITTQQNTISGLGYDFGIDDIVFGEKILYFDIVAPAKACEDEDFNISVSNLCGTPPYTYLWNTNETTSQITTHINTSTTFSVTVTDANAQSTTSSILVEPLICCESTHQDYTWTEETISTTSEYTFDNQTIHINGDVILDGKFTFSNCTIELAPNASLILGNEDKVFTGNTITYCRDYIWKEIKMLACNNSFVNFNENIIEYSINGIVNETSRKTDINGNQFINNYEQSINISDWQSCSSSLNIRNNTIKYSNNTFVNPYIGERPKLGILLMNNNLNGSHLNIGHGNSFLDLGNGIYSISSDVNIFNNTFENIGFNNISDPTAKVAIYAIGYSTYEPNEITIGGDSQNSNTFNNCLNGIYVSHNYNCLISHNTISDKTNGMAIRLAHLNGYNLESTLTLPNLAIVENNNINNYTYGIYASTNAHSNILIRNNSINCPTNQSDISRGVSINGLKIKNEKYVITSNIINNATYGIYANYTFEASIRGNNILSLKQHPSTSFSSRGIHVLGSNRTEIIDNKVVGLTLPSDAHGTLGVHIENSTRSDVLCNELRTLGSCFRGTQNCTDSRIYNNKFYTSRNGLTLANSGNIGNQGSLSNPSNNIWEPSVAYWMNSNDQDPHFTYGSNGSVCTLFVDQGQKTGIFYSSIATDFLNLASAFSVNNNATGINSIPCPGQGGIIPIDPINLNMAKDLIDENLYQPTYEEESYEIAKSEYLHILPEDSSAMADINIQNFISNMYNEPKGILADVHRLIEQKEYIAARSLNSSFQALTIIEETEQVARSIQLNLLENDSISYNEIIILEQLADLCPFTHGQGVYIARSLYTLIDPLYAFVNICETDPSFAPKKKQITDKEQQILIYPNPASDIVNFELKNIDLEGNLIVQISDVNGRIVLNKTTEIRLINTLNVSNLTNGCYSLKIILSTGQTFNEKICLTK